MTLTELAQTLESADKKWRKEQGYSGKPVHKMDYWLYLAAVIMHRDEHDG